jgi:hypothetical protein
MSLRTKLTGLVAAGALVVASSAALVPGTASAALTIPPPVYHPPVVLSISGVLASNHVAAYEGGNGDYLTLPMFPSGQPVTFTSGLTWLKSPVRVIASDTFDCKDNYGNYYEYTVDHDTAFGTATVTFQPDVTCPTGQALEWTVVTAHAQDEAGATTPGVGFYWFVDPNA